MLAGLAAVAVAIKGRRDEGAGRPPRDLAVAIASPTATSQPSMESTVMPAMPIALRSTSQG